MRIGVMIESIANGYLVTFATGPTASDPLAQRGPVGQTFADTREAVCGLISAEVLRLPEPAGKRE